MAKRFLLSDENCIGQVEAIFHEFSLLGYAELFEVELLTWNQTGLIKGADDETVWKFCQEHGYLLITGNRSGKKREKSLEYVIRHLVTVTSLPVLTISNLKRVPHDRDYRVACAQGLADILYELKSYYGITRLYLTG